MFVDLVKHTFLVNHPVSVRDAEKTAVVASQKTETYCSLKSSLETAYGKSLRPRQARKVSPLLPLCHGIFCYSQVTYHSALLAWIDVKAQNPTVSNITDFTHLVSLKISELSLPSSICTGKEIEEFIVQLDSHQLSGVAAIVAGILSQDVLNALGGRELPVKNWLIFDGRSCTIIFDALTNFQVRERYIIYEAAQMEVSCMSGETWRSARRKGRR